MSRPQTRAAAIPVMTSRSESVEVTSPGPEEQGNWKPQNIARESQADSADTVAGSSHRTTSSGNSSRSSNGGFVSKLYKYILHFLLHVGGHSADREMCSMIEDGTNTAVIWWSEAGDSFMVNPGPDFHNVLAYVDFLPQHLR